MQIKDESEHDLRELLRSALLYAVALVLVFVVKLLHVEETLAELIFSAVLLTIISIIVGGKLLAPHLRLQTGTSQSLHINFLILRMQSSDDEVVAGFTGFIIILLIAPPWLKWTPGTGQIAK
jgi:hypothetical protein